MPAKLRQIHLRLDEETYEMIENISKRSNESFNQTVRILLKKGLALNVTEENIDPIAELIRSQLEIIIKPHVERLASLSSKTGHMAATAAFLNMQALQGLVPKERHKDLIELWEKARKKAAAYMKTKAEEWDDLLDE